MEAALVIGSYQPIRFQCAIYLIASWIVGNYFKDAPIIPLAINNYLGGNGFPLKASVQTWFVCYTQVVVIRLPSKRYQNQDSLSVRFLSPLQKKRWLRPASINGYTAKNAFDIINVMVR
jgi:hypothetical protein